MFYRRHKQLVVIFASLVIFLAQFAVLVHATDHPFHQEESLCVAFQSAAHDKHFFNHVPVIVFSRNYIVELAPQLAEQFYQDIKLSYSSRAPPENNA